MTFALQGLETDDPIRVDLDALWQKAAAQGRDVSMRVKQGLKIGLADVLDDRTGELAIISAWARNKGKKG